jgi:hypothetical protein
MGYTCKGSARMLRKLRVTLVDNGALVLVRQSSRGRSPTWQVVTDPAAEPAPFPWLGGH